MAHDDLVEHRAVIHDAAHHARILHAAAVVGEGHRAMSHHVAHFGERLALEPLAARARHVHAALAYCGCARLDVLHAQRVVDNGLGVGHAAHRREAAVSRRARSGSDVFLLLEAGLAQMHVHVHQARNHDLAGKVALDALLHGQALAHLDDLAVADQDVGRFVQTHLRVDHTGVLKQQSHLRSLREEDTFQPYG